MVFAVGFINLVFQVYTLMLFCRILVSWLPELYEYKAVKFVCFYTDPYLNFFRRFIPPLGMIDISPIFAFLCLSVVKSMIITLMIGFNA